MKKIKVGKYHILAYKDNKKVSKNGRPRIEVPVDDIVNDNLINGMSERALARKYGVSKTKIHNVLQSFYNKLN